MKKTFAVIPVLIFLIGCAGPKYSGMPITPNIYSSGHKIDIIEHKATRKGFMDAIQNWLTSNHYEFSIRPQNSQHNNENISLEYIGLWSWDLGIFLADAKINAFHDGEQKANVEYKAPNTFDANKFGHTIEKIGYMMDILFGKKTVSEANLALKSFN